MIIIPARLASSRFPKKVLTDIAGVPMVVATAKRVLEIDDVAIATDSPEIYEVGEKFGFKCVITSGEHQSGTDRINEAADILGLSDDEIVVNVQADEPFIEKEVVLAIKERVKYGIAVKEDFAMTSCYKIIDPAFASDPNHVKVVCDSQNYAIYFSRSKIPYDREEHFNYYGHLGIYGFSRKSLREFCNFKVAPIEHIEKLEQLRALYYGKKISMIEVKSKSFGIDTIEDLNKAKNIFNF